MVEQEKRVGTRACSFGQVESLLVRLSLPPADLFNQI